MKEIPDEDIKISKENDLCLVIKRKAKQGAKWLHVKEIVSDIREAILQATNIQDFQVGVFVKSENGSFIYWTNNNPELFNSPVLTQVVFLRGQHYSCDEGDSY